MIDQSALNLTSAHAAKGGGRDRHGLGQQRDKDMDGFSSVLNAFEEAADVTKTAAKEFFGDLKSQLKGQADGDFENTLKAKLEALGAKLGFGADFDMTKLSMSDVASILDGLTDGDVKLADIMSLMGWGKDEPGKPEIDIDPAKLVGVKAGDAAAEDQAEEPADLLRALLGLPDEGEGEDDRRVSASKADSQDLGQADADSADKKPDDALKAAMPDDGAKSAARQAAEVLQASDMSGIRGNAHAEDRKSQGPRDPGAELKPRALVVSQRNHEAADEASPNARTDMVHVLEARRYLGFSSDSNAATLTRAIGGDRSWIEAMRAAQGVTQSSQPTASEVNTLKLQMNPANLGNMTAYLRLKEDQLTIEVRVETMEAYRQLTKDQEGMLSALRDQGFSIDQVSVQLAPAAKAEAGRDDSQQQQPGGNLDAREEGDQARQRERNERQHGSNERTFDEKPLAQDNLGGRRDVASAGELYL